MNEQQIRDRFGGDLPGGWDEDPFNFDDEEEDMIPESEGYAGIDTFGHDVWTDTADEGSEEYGSPSAQPYLDKHDVDGPTEEPFGTLAWWRERGPREGG